MSLRSSNRRRSYLSWIAAGGIYLGHYIVVVVVGIFFLLLYFVFWYTTHFCGRWNFELIFVVCCVYSFWFCVVCHDDERKAGQELQRKTDKERDRERERQSERGERKREKTKLIIKCNWNFIDLVFATKQNENTPKYEHEIFDKYNVNEVYTYTFL